MTISLEALEKRYPDGTFAVKGIDLDIREGEFVTLLGPSGCGKTTTLRLVAGLEDPTGGRVLINGRDVTNIDPGDRDIAMVFQSYALYPHMTVAQNMTLNLTVRGMSKADALARARDTARLLGIEELLDKRPAKLSGGQRQRVALGRAMVRNPAAFLMDEPLSNLDLKLREQMRTELKALHARLKITTIYVTHDQTEALILSDRVVVMSGGRIEQADDPIRIYERPTNRFVAEFVGSPSINLLRATVSGDAVFVAAHRVATVPEGAALPKEVIVGVRPEHLSIRRSSSRALTGTIAFTEPYGSAIYAFVDLGETADVLVNRRHLVAAMDIHRPISAGEEVEIAVVGGRMTVFDPTSGAALITLSELGPGAARAEAPTPHVRLA